MSVSVAAGHARAGRWVLAVAPVLVAVILMVGFGLAGGGAAASRPATNPAVPVPGLLRAGDAGAGWTATHTGALEVEPPGCFRPRAALMAGPASSLVGVVLTGPGGIARIDEMAARYTTPSEAAAGFRSVARVLDRCTGPVPMTLPVRSERSAAALVTTAVGSRTAVVDFVVAEEGTGVVLLDYATAGVPDAVTVLSLADRAVARLGP